MAQNSITLNDLRKTSNNGRRLSGVLFPPAHRKTYRNLVYLLLSLLLGTFYFAFFTAAFAVGVSTVIGVAILAGALLASRQLASFERRLTRRMLSVEIPEPTRASETTFWRRAVAEARNHKTYKELAYLWLLRFPMGVAAVAATLAALGVVLAFLGAPIVVQFHEIRLWDTAQGFPWVVNGTAEALWYTAAGLVGLWLTMSLMNGLARLHGALAKVMLS